MPKQSILRLIKRWKRYQPKDSWSTVPKNTRGLYVLYRNTSGDHFEVVYIGVAGLGQTGGGGVRSRLKSHVTRIKNWTHYSVFEVHDNVTREEIRELESLLLGMFRHDPRIQLTNKQKGSKKLYQLRNAVHWRETESNKPRKRRHAKGRRV
jgi:hypothetical protein